MFSVEMVMVVELALVCSCLVLLNQEKKPGDYFFHDVNFVFSILKLVLVQMFNAFKRVSLNIIHYYREFQMLHNG